MDATPKIRVGPAGWSYKDWEGTVYPPHGSKFDHLAYLASFFDTIEINSPFYRIPPPTHAKSWVRRVANNPDFRFTTKVFRGFTHEKAQIADSDVKAFRSYLDPLMEADRLGAILRRAEDALARNHADVAPEGLQRVADLGAGLLRDLPLGHGRGRPCW